jgi:glycosyltransferase involved in cell wall biosynthesis
MKEKKKILFAVTKGNWGGAQRYVYDMATNLPKADFDIVVACGEGNTLAEKLKVDGIRTIRLSSLKRDMSILGDLKSFFEFYRVLLSEKPDIIHLNSSKIGGIGAFAGRLTGVPKIVFTGHGWAWNESRPVSQKILIGLAHWLTLALTHSTIAVSNKIRADISQIPFVNKNKITVVHNGVKDTEYTERFSARAILNGEVSEKFWVGTISELHHNKGLDILIRAFANISRENASATLIIIGDGEERNNLSKLVSDLGMTKKVHMLGFVDNAHKYLKAFDVFVLASRTEAFPYVPLEAGLAQLPVVASSVGGIPEVIVNGKNGLLVEKENVDSLKHAINELLQDSTKAATFGHNLRKTVEENYTIMSMVEKTIAIYN